MADGPVLADAVLQPDAPVAADPGNLSLNETVAGLKAKGVDFDTRRRPKPRRCCWCRRRQQLGPSYRVGFKNFEVITRYNRSVRYAMAVHDLATTIAGRVAATDAAATRRLRSSPRKSAETTTAAR